MKSITVRGIDSELATAVKKQASLSGVSINQWLLKSLKKLTGLDKKPSFIEYHDLDHLAGGWTDKDLEIFNKNTEYFEKVDLDLWK